MNAPHHPNVERVLEGTDWRLLRQEEAQSFNAAYERAHRQWLARNVGDANTQARGFEPLYNEPQLEPELLTPARVLIGCGVFLAVCVAVAVAALQFWR